MISVKNASDIFSSVASESRLSILKILIDEHPNKLSISDINTRVNMAPTTLSHHIRSLVSSELITQEKIGREVMCQANCDVIDKIIAFLNGAYTVDKKNCSI